MRIRGLVALLAAIAAFAVGASSASAVLTAPAGQPPGSNDFGCRPSAAHPRPVILTHGLSASGPLNWATLSPRLKARGYCVFAPTYGLNPLIAFLGVPGGILPMEQSSREYAAFVDRVRAATGASKVDIVGHSEGTVMPRWYLEKLGGAAKVQKFVALTPLWRGTTLLGLDQVRDLGAQFGLAKPVLDLLGVLCGSCSQFLRGSDYLNALNADGEAVPGIEHTNIVTKYDELVSPYTSGIMRDGGTNVVLQDVCPNDFSEHGLVAFDPVVATMVENALDPEHAQPVRCG
ncbi:esterase/lipase family protein [Patulibacter defluvii]|uniref:esterase/lipase family protein n=1 Tax=Patulibacter defluvii TaxID=3095358 RepID=UPI002A74AE13|nr:alpha/beta fold hydrolase [Patulibacter sp. DM4]